MAFLAPPCSHTIWHPACLHVLQRLEKEASYGNHRSNGHQQRGIERRDTLRVIVGPVGELAECPDRDGAGYWDSAAARAARQGVAPSPAGDGTLKRGSRGG